MSGNVAETRRVSAQLFGNEKVVEVILALDGTDGAKVVTAQHLSKATQIGHGMVRDVLQRLVGAGVLRALPKVGGSRSAQYYQPADYIAWDRIVAVADWVAHASGSLALADRDSQPADP